MKETEYPVTGTSLRHLKACCKCSKTMEEEHDEEVESRWGEVRDDIDI